MKKNQFEISDSMAAVKSDLPEFTWDDIIRFGLSFCRIIASEDNSDKYKRLYWLSKIEINELIASYR
jgi:hypothetical protein